MNERIAKIMARRGLCSRREAERLIAAGHVRVAGVLVTAQGYMAAENAEITISEEASTALAEKLTVALHKPIGVVSALPGPGQTEAARLLVAGRAADAVAAEVRTRVEAQARSFSVAGRLDRASRGLLILTQDGTIARHIIGGHGVRKVYRVSVAEPVNDGQLRKLGGRLQLDGMRLQPMKVERLGERALRFTLVEGRKHQIRRVCRKVGLTVTDLLRESVGPIRLAQLPEGCWRLVTASELADLLRG